jgi:hypothetical protein
MFSMHVELLLKTLKLLKTGRSMSEIIQGLKYLGSMDTTVASILEASYAVRSLAGICAEDLRHSIKRKKILWRTLVQT